MKHQTEERYLILPCDLKKVRNNVRVHYLGSGPVERILSLLSVVFLQ